MVDVYIYSEIDPLPLGLAYNTSNFMAISDMLTRINAEYEGILKEVDLTLIDDEIKTLETEVKQWILKNIKLRVNPSKPKKAVKGYLEKQVFGQFIRLDTKNNPNDGDINYMYSLFLMIERVVRNNLKVYFYNVSDLDDESEVFSTIKQANKALNINEILRALQEKEEVSKSFTDVKNHLEKLVNKKMVESNKGDCESFYVSEKGRRVYL